MKALDRLWAAQPKEAVQLGIAALAYAAVFLVEGVGLLFRKRWAEWLTVGVTASFVPVEVYEMVHRFGIGKVIALVLNIAIVAYLVWHRLGERRPHAPRRPRLVRFHVEGREGLLDLARESGRGRRRRCRERGRTLSRRACGSAASPTSWARRRHRGQRLDRPMLKTSRPAARTSGQRNDGEIGVGSYLTNDAHGGSRSRPQASPVPRRIYV